jgi:hypothetical protein
VLFTDGVTDTRGAPGRFGGDRLGAVLADATALEPDDVATRVDQALIAFEEGPQRDDVALLVLRATGEPGAGTSVVGVGVGIDPAAERSPGGGAAR